MPESTAIQPERSRKGGARPGAGRKPKLLAIEGGRIVDPKEFLLRLVSDDSQSAYLRTTAAKALMPYMHHRLAEGGKKESRQAEARKASEGKFATSTPPKLALIRPKHKS
ncbi:MAG: hypothetical protein KJZ92_04865 [Rhodocyclaceae bacterium]|nr:hypothetical protein [Rhodocyclaceae bacterium]